MKTTYVPKNFNPVSEAIIVEANDIIAEYAAQGYELTLRQLYYQFVSRETLPDKWISAVTGSKNNERSYKKLGGIISDARLAGLMDWNAITDRTRQPRILQTFDSPKEVLEDAIGYFRYDVWAQQESYVEVWVEKEALAQVIQRAGDKYHVPTFCCRGYVSQSAMHEAALRIRRQEQAGKECHIIYLGDHDPSGIDMSRDITDRQTTFRNWDLENHRVALNMDQVEQYDPPPNPTKVTDSRSGGYIDSFGYDCWELDALEPSVLHRLIQDKVESLLDMDQMRDDWETQTELRNELQEIADRY